MRDEVLPATGLHADVGAPTAQSADFRAETLSQGPWIAGLVLALTFGILLVTFRSVVVPLKAIALNLSSSAASARRSTAGCPRRTPSATGCGRQPAW